MSILLDLFYRKGGDEKRSDHKVEINKDSHGGYLEGMAWEEMGLTVLERLLQGFQFHHQFQHGFFGLFQRGF